MTKTFQDFQRDALRVHKKVIKRYQAIQDSEEDKMEEALEDRLNREWPEWQEDLAAANAFVNAMRAIGVEDEE